MVIRRKNNRLEEYEKELVELHTKSYDNYDKKLSYLSASSIGVSMVFLKDIVGNVDEIKIRGLLLIAWTLLTLTLVLNLFSHTFTAKRHNATLSEIRSNNYRRENAENRNKQIRYFNIVINVLFGFGIGSLVIFVIINLK
jgi:hypothetical protein